jgi:GH15 family glucan-1,4-alpha-glucosidase
MPAWIEDYALLADCQSVALVAKDGSIDWLCLPRFDSGACFAALLGSPENGRWQIAPAGAVKSVGRHYRDGTMVLETDYETDDGSVTVIDAMPIRTAVLDVVRVVKGTRGAVRMRMELVIRFDYGSVVPWVQRVDGGLQAIAGPDLLRLVTPVEMHGENLKTVADFVVRAGERVPFVLTWSPSHQPAPSPIDSDEAIEQTAIDWKAWSDRCTYAGPYAGVVKRSLLTLKAMTYAPTGGIVAAATTSLPEQLGGVRNWDYRYCWLRDATFTLYSLMNAGYADEARAWRDWLLRAIAGEPSKLQVLYGIAGERRVSEAELPWLGGYKGAKPVRIGNAASRQLQLDVYGEVMDALHLCQRVGLADQGASWQLQRALLGFLEDNWNLPDEGIWEVRGPRRHFTHSKVMAWVAFDRAVKSVEQFGLEGPLDRWRAVRSEIHRSVCTKAFDASRGAFVQFYGAKELDAGLLVMPLVGFLPATDPRVLATVAAIERQLMREGLVARYATESNVDGLPSGEGAFLPCSFWLADNYVLQGRRDEARALFERLVALCNDVGLLAEEYDPQSGHLVGNFPQAISHVSLVNTALNLSAADGPANHRRRT